MGQLELDDRSNRAGQARNFSVSLPCLSYVIHCLLFQMACPNIPAVVVDCPDLPLPVLVLMFAFLSPFSAKENSPFVAGSSCAFVLFSVNYRRAHSPESIMARLMTGANTL